VFISGGSKLEKKITSMMENKLRRTSTYMRCIASKTINIEIRIRKIPFANPDSVSIRPYLKRDNN